MQVALTSLAALIFMTSVGFGNPDRPVATVSAPRLAGAVITYDGFTADHHALVDWALALFEEAGLELAPIHFVASADYEPCQGRSGIARHRGGVSEITLCGERLGPAHGWLALHELAHVFERHGLGDSQRQAFMDLRGLTEWREGDWHDRGAEHAAEIIAWGLMDRPTRPGHIDQNTCEDLLAGYVTLIGRAPLHGHTEACAG